MKVEELILERICSSNFSQQHQLAMSYFKIANWYCLNALHSIYASFNMINR
jgi:hypothetical protein